MTDADRIAYLADDGFNTLHDAEWSPPEDLTVSEIDAERVTPGSDATFEGSLTVTLRGHDAATLLGWLADVRPCVHCGRGFADDAALETHLRDAHGLEP